ncbi:hypothetical protein LPH44_06935 [Xylella taiwanensis]|nr:hypothetical protein [Xylella taiwanensis]MCD8465815.1 hypothetical protein [Xylella taiwanensis]MCD8474105.1 hypothetical protein [Xylella taiwanensis]UFM93866.1 hypothetical protein LPH39_00700 [Xylella taiwanensis]UFN10491.1 hypothetical protein LPH44_06935 [Xylella taiwanensis]UFN41438.1 hypothetical protein LPH57_00775 [Xylella taiwanensis]
MSGACSTSRGITVEQQIQCALGMTLSISTPADVRGTSSACLGKYFLDGWLGHQSLRRQMSA